MTRVYATGTTAATVIAAPAAGSRIEVMQVIVSASTAAATVTFNNGSGGASMCTVIPDHSANRLKGPGNEPLFVLSPATLLEVAASAGNFYVTIHYRVV